MEKEQIITYHKCEQRTKIWHDSRLGKMSGSKIKDIIDVKKRGMLKSKDVVLTAVADCVSELLTGISNDSHFVNEAMQWGIDTEDEVFELLASEKTFQVGGVTNSAYKYFWLSPDLLDGDKKAFEVKCPTSKTFIKYLLKNEVPTEYLPQILSYFVTMPYLKTVTFVAYDPRVNGTNILKIDLHRQDYSDFICNIADSLFIFCDMIDKAITEIRKN